MEFNVKQIVFSVSLLLIGSVLGVHLLLSFQSVNLVTSGCDNKPRVLHVVYALPYSGNTSYSDDDVNSADDCDSQ